MNKKFKIVFIIAILFFIVSFVVNWENKYFSSHIPNDVKASESISEIAKIPAKIGETPIFLERAVTSEERELGLSYRESLREDSGLLFVFDTPDFYGFWMKEMRFPIDIIWLDSDLKIVDMVERAQPESYPKVFTPIQKSLYVLEVNSGFVSKHKIKIGDILSISNL